MRHRPDPASALARPGSFEGIRRDRSIGWVFVAIQGLLLVVLIVIPDGTLWTVTGWMNTVALALIVWASSTDALSSLFDAVLARVRSYV